jgi:signal transduction histidine kinase
MVAGDGPGIIAARRVDWRRTSDRAVILGQLKSTAHPPAARACWHDGDTAATAFLIAMPFPSLLRDNRRTILMVGWLLGVLLLLTSLFAAYTLRNATRSEWSGQLNNLSTVLAEHAGQTMFSAHTVMDSIADEFTGHDFRSAHEFERFASTRELQARMVDRIAGNPIIDVASVVAPDGRLLTFTRSYPPPPIDLSDRDYFKAHRADPELDHFTSMPVRNKGNGKWVFYITQPVRNTQGRTVGLLLVGVSVEWFSDFYRRMVTQIGEGASISLWRDDFMLLTRWPFTPEQIGKINLDTATFDMIGRQKLDHAVQTRGAVVDLNGEGGVDRLTAPRRVQGYPLIVTPSVNEEIFLRNWRETLRWIAVTTGLSLILLVLGVRALLGSDRQRQDELQERRLAQARLHSAHEQLEQRVAERTADLRREIAEREVAQRELAHAQQSLADTSRRAGMAEVANSVLHNVGNVLNSINVSVTLVGEQLRGSPLRELPRAAELLQQHGGTQLAQYLEQDPQGRLLPGYFVLLGRHWQDDQTRLQDEVEQLTRNVQHVKDIVARQQSLSGQSGLVSQVDVCEVIDEVVAIHRRSLDDVNVQVVKQHVGPAQWRGDRGKLTQILLNLLVNAEQSLAAMPAGTDTRRVTLSSTVRADASLLLDVRDNGSGIAPEVQDRLFTYGYTTKVNGHGFGLHASALAAQEMGGSLTATSAGTGLGASFILDLPAAGPSPEPASA